MRKVIVFLVVMLFANPYTPAKNATPKESSVNAQSRIRCHLMSVKLKRSWIPGYGGWY
jgi:hypothetical protein